MEETTRQERRMPANATGGRRQVRQHGSLKRQADSLGSLPNPSLLSVISDLTNTTNTSSGSNSTITQKSYDKTCVSKPRPAKGRKKLQPKRAPPKSKAMESPQPSSNVFQYLNGGTSPEHFSHDRPSSSGSSASESSDVTDIDEGRSSNAEEHPVESAMTSPASSKHPIDEMGSSFHERYGHDSGVQLHERSAESTPHPPEHHLHNVDEEDDEDEEEDDEEDEEDSEEEEEDEANEADDGHTHSEDTGVSHAYALERAAPPRVPSSSSHKGDRRYQRLQDQEQQLRDHVLQAPQPHRGFQFVGAPSPSPHPSMPPPDPYTYPDPSSAPFYGQTPHAPGWPPPTQPPPPIGYHSPPQMPPALYPENSHAMTARSPMAVTSPASQPPPFPHMHAQPPYYQPFPVGPDPNRTTVVGYELLADKLSEVRKEKDGVPTKGNVVPMYRKFEKLNHRVLLHLQDEISELEEELRLIDESIARTVPGHEVGQMVPASRRADARYGGELHHRRTDLLGRIYLKLGQYSTHF